MDSQWVVLSLRLFGRRIRSGSIQVWRNRSSGQIWSSEVGRYFANSPYHTRWGVLLVCITLYHSLSHCITQDGGCYILVCITLYHMRWSRERLLMVIDIRRAADFPLVACLASMVALLQLFNWPLYLMHFPIQGVLDVGVLSYSCFSSFESIRNVEREQAGDKHFSLSFCISSLSKVYFFLCENVFLPFWNCISGACWLRACRW